MNPAAKPQFYADEKHEEWAEEDDLGYYEDGVKRTLTDEEIEIFRHSELETLRREEEQGIKRKPAIDDVGSNDKSESANLSQSNNKKKKWAKRPKPEPKPDLRKRTWDVVEPGLDTLDYD